VRNGQLALLFGDGRLRLLDTVTGKWVTGETDPCNNTNVDPLDVTDPTPVTTYDGKVGTEVNTTRTNIRGTPNADVFYDSSTQTFVSVEFDNLTTDQNFALVWTPFNELNGDVTVGTVVESMLRSAGLKTKDFNLTPLYQIPLKGYGFANETDVKSVIEELRRIYLFDLVEIDGRLVARVRGDANTADITIKQAFLGSSSPTANDYWRETRIQEADIPEKVSLTYMNFDQDYEASTASSKRVQNPRPTMFSRQQLSLQANIVFQPKEAKDRANMMLYEQWLERTKHNTRLPWAFLTVDPSDLIEVVMNDGRSYFERVNRIETGADYNLVVETYGQDSGAYEADTVADGGGGGFSQQVVPVAKPAFPIILNTPLLRDADDLGGSASRYYVALGNSSSGKFYGAVLYDSNNNADYVQVVSETNEAEYGVVIGRLAPPPDNNWAAPDTVNTITLAPGPNWFSVESITDDVLLAGGNPVVVGQEIIQFRDAVHNEDGTWTLSYLLRGRRGTDYAIGTHGAGEKLITLDPLWLTTETQPVTMKGQPLYFKAVASGMSLVETPPTGITFTPRDLMPYSPVHIAREMSGSDVAISWMRRDRLAGSAWLDQIADIPLSETTEQYDVYILSAPYAEDASVGASPASYVRKATVTSPAYTYLAADQATDGFDPATDTLHLAIFQISALVGNGFPGVISIGPND
jgi:hypothetical protein